MQSKNNEQIVHAAVERGELEIDHQGRIWRLANRTGGRKGVRVTPCQRRRAEHDCGAYYQVRVMVELKRTYCLAHRLAWLHFKGTIPPGLTVNHKNGLKKDNRLDNLELATYSEQAIHALHTLKVGRIDQRRAKNAMSKLTDAAVAEILATREIILAEIKTRHGLTISELAKKFGVSYQTVWNVIRGRSWIL